MLAALPAREAARSARTRALRLQPHPLTTPAAAVAAAVACARLVGSALVQHHHPLVQLFLARRHRHRGHYPRRQVPLPHLARQRRHPHPSRCRWMRVRMRMSCPQTRVAWCRCSSLLRVMGGRWLDSGEPRSPLSELLGPSQRNEQTAQEGDIGGACIPSNRERNVTTARVCRLHFERGAPRAPRRTLALAAV